MLESGDRSGAVRKERIDQQDQDQRIENPVYCTTPTQL
jgi:hypothetical protein